MSEQHDLMNIVLGDAQLPSPTTDAAWIMKNELDIKNWKRRDSTDRCFIVSTIEQTTTCFYVNQHMAFDFD